MRWSTGRFLVILPHTTEEVTLTRKRYGFIGGLRVFLIKALPSLAQLCRLTLS